MGRAAVSTVVVAALTAGVIASAGVALVLARGCLPVRVDEEPRRVPYPPRPASPPEPARLKEILTDLGRWDAATTPERRAAAEDVARRLPDFALLRLETFSCGGQTHEVAVYSHAKTGMEFVLVPVGTFLMGSPESEAELPKQEVQHSVTLTLPYLIARTPTTQSAWARVMKTNPSGFRDDALPVEGVSWVEAQSFCAKAGFELPTEAQWEYACRGGTTTKWCFGIGESRIAEFAWRNDDGALMTTHAVGQKRPNAFGVRDMHGNVREWCADFFGPYDGAAATDPRGPATGRERVIRGDGYLFLGHGAGSARRCLDLPGVTYCDLGFRPAKTVPAE